MERRILVVDDNKATRDVMTILLVQEEYDVVVAENAFKALELLEDGCKPDLILLDQRMPLMNGDAFIQILQERHMRDAQPIIIMSADVKATKLTDQVEGVVHKPFDVYELLDIIEQTIKQPVKVL